MSIREAIKQQAQTYLLNGYDLARLIKRLNGGEWVVSCEHMQAYLDGEKDMTSSKIDAVLDALHIKLSISTEPVLMYEGMPNGNR